MTELDQALATAKMTLAVPRYGALSEALRDLIAAIDEKLDDMKRGWT